MATPHPPPPEYAEAIASSSRGHLKTISKSQQNRTRRQQHARKEKLSYVSNIVSEVDDSVQERMAALDLQRGDSRAKISLTPTKTKPATMRSEGAATTGKKARKQRSRRAGSRPKPIRFAIYEEDRASTDGKKRLRSPVASDFLLGTETVSTPTTLRREQRAALNNIFRIHERVLKRRAVRRWRAKGASRTVAPSPQKRRKKHSVPPRRNKHEASMDVPKEKIVAQSIVENESYKHALEAFEIRLVQSPTSKDTLRALNVLQNVLQAPVSSSFSGKNATTKYGVKMTDIVGDDGEQCLRDAKAASQRRLQVRKENLTCMASWDARYGITAKKSSRKDAKSPTSSDTAASPLSASID
eukprot:g3495.t1